VKLNRNVKLCEKVAELRAHQLALDLLEPWQDRGPQFCQIGSKSLVRIDDVV